jgi:hypothetical protein
MSKRPSIATEARRLGHPSHGRCRWAAAALLSSGALALTFPPSQAKADVLYTLETNCTLRGGAPVACKVQAVDEEGATLYRHTIGATIHTLRISDQPARLSLWDATSKRWEPLRGAAVRFSTNTLCLNDGELCVVNPNYLNSLLQERADFRGRDLVRVRFDSSGRINIVCYDSGCDLLTQKREAR